MLQFDKKAGSIFAAIEKEFHYANVKLDVFMDKTSY